MDVAQMQVPGRARCEAGDDGGCAHASQPVAGSGRHRQGGSRMDVQDGPRFGPVNGGAPDALVVLVHGFGADGNDLIAGAL